MEENEIKNLQEQNKRLEFKSKKHNNIHIASAILILMLFILGTMFGDVNAKQKIQKMTLDSYLNTVCENNSTYAIRCVRKDATCTVGIKGVSNLDNLTYP